MREQLGVEGLGLAPEEIAAQKPFWPKLSMFRDDETEEEAIEFTDPYLQRPGDEEDAPPPPVVRSA